MGLLVCYRKGSFGCNEIATGLVNDMEFYLFWDDFCNCMVSLYDSNLLSTGSG